MSLKLLRLVCTLLVLCVGSAKMEELRSERKSANLGLKGQGREAVDLLRTTFGNLKVDPNDGGARSKKNRVWSAIDQVEKIMIG